ncbi:MAG TPA: SWIM zinc finger family protein [Roseiflexaceae bacterium]|nr:SWIM zinc finger family protein [Roseiflexaceae bacterium]
MPIPRLSEADIRQQATPEVFLRGTRYAQSGAVLELVLRGDQLAALVEGSAEEPYHVSVIFDAHGPKEANCTCPYEFEGWCKHIVGALLAALNEPDEVEEREPLGALLSQLDRDELQGLLLRLTALDSSLADALEREVSLLRSARPSPPDKASAAPTPAAPIRDPRPFRRQVRSAFVVAYDETGYTAPIIEQMRALIDQAIQIGADGDWRGALLILESITDEYVESWYEIEEEGTELADFFHELGAAWAEALLAADLTDEDRRDWRDELADWREAAEEYDAGKGLEIAERAAEQGWSDPAIVTVLAGAHAGLGTTLPEDALSRELNRRRLIVLEGQGRTEEYLRLAEAAGLAVFQSIALVRQGRAAEAVEVGLRRLTSAEEALELARALHDHGLRAEALRIAEHGLELATPHAPLAVWLIDQAVEQGRSDLALRAAEVAFRSTPSLVLYLRLRELAGDDWPPLRENLLDFLRQGRASWQIGPSAVEIFLEEDLLDDAIAVVDAGTAPVAQLHVMDLAVERRPDWVIAAATRAAEQIIEPSRSAEYSEAVDWLRRAHAAYRAAGREAEWRSYIANLRVAHSRKYKLMDLLQRFERTL